MNRTIIVSGGYIDKEFLKRHLKENTYENIIAVDKGLHSLYELNIEPMHIVGDFDSLDNSLLEKYKSKEEKIKIHSLIPEKDFTDTHIAFDLAIKMHSTSITLVGCSGSRFDHSLSNIYVLINALDKNIPCKLLDVNNEIFLINKTTDIKEDEHYTYLSLLPFTDIVTGVTLKGFRYPLNNKTLTKQESIGISNEQLDNIATIELKTGILIVVKSKD